MPRAQLSFHFQWNIKQLKKLEKLYLEKWTFNLFLLNKRLFKSAQRTHLKGQNVDRQSGIVENMADKYSGENVSQTKTFS